MPCPNKNLKSWKDLVAALGDNEALAMAAYTMNNWEVPSISLAKQLIENSKKVKDKDISQSETLKKNRLERLESQITTLDNIIKNTKEEEKLATLNKLKQNMLAYKDVLNSDQPSVSVSNLIAGGEIEEGEKYQNYAEFGTFVHYVIEELQKEILNTDKSITSVFNRAKLKNIYNKYGRKFNITNLIENGSIVNEEELFNMTNDIVAVLQGYISLGYSVLPEMTIVGKDRFGRNIVGRLDIMAIDNKGRVAVLDIKSKKLKFGAKVDSLNYPWPVNSSSYTDELFVGGRRTAYDNWDLQLGVYANLLAQLDIPTSEKRIILLEYYGSYENPEGKQFTDLGEDTFSYKMYKVNSYVSSEFNRESDSDSRKFKNLTSKINKVIPLSETQKENTKETNRDKIAYNLTKEEADRLVKDLLKITEDQIKETKFKLSETKKKDEGSPSIKYYEERLTDLNKIKSALLSNKNEWTSAHKVGYVIDTLRTDMANLVETSEKLNDKYKNADPLTQAKELERLNKIAVGYNLVLNELERILLDSGIKNTSGIFNAIDDINKNIKKVKSFYTQLGYRFAINMLKDSLSSTQVVKLNDEVVQSTKDRIAYKKKQLERLRELDKTGEVGFWNRISNPVKKAFNQDVDPQTKAEKLELEIEQLELKLQGINLDEDSIKTYLKAILDPSSAAYIGQGTTFFSQGIAASSSSDWTLSSYANQLKIALSTSMQKFVNFVAKENIQGEFNDYIQGKTLEEANQLISELRKTLRFDENGNESVVTTKAFVDPLSEEYRNIIDRYRNKVRQLTTEIRNELNQTKLKELKDAKSKLVKEHLQWRLENTEMRYIREVYEIEKFLPDEYKDRRNELIEEKSLLESSAGFNNVEYLDESVLDRIAEIDIDLNKLKYEYASKKEGGYAKYLELLDKYYDYETNWNYFERLRNQKIQELSDINGNIDTEAFQKWKDQNMIRVPKQEWYDKVGEIWDQIFLVIGRSNEDVQKLNEKYREIVKQYKRKGFVDSRFMTQEDIDTIDEIENLIAVYKQAGGGSALDYEDRMQLQDLFIELESIQVKKDNPFYIKEFNKRVDDLGFYWNKYLQSEEGVEKDKALEQFLINETEFRDWYDNNHVNKYVSKLVSTEGLNPVPKRFNLITVPSSEDNFDERPDYKYTIRKLKPSAYNINYSESQGYPLPKGLKIDGALVTGNSPWLNQKYLSIRNNTSISKFYHSFVGRFLDRQRKTTGKMLGYNFPGYEARSLDDFKDRDIADFAKNRVKMFRDKNLKIASEYDFSINNYNTDVEDRIQFKHNVPLPIDQQTSDGISAVTRWFEQSFVNESMAEVQASSKVVISFMENLYEDLANSNFPGIEKRKESLRRVIELMKFEYSKYVKGEWKKDEGIVGRIADLGLKGFGITRLALDLPNQIGNMLSGNVQAFLGTSKSGIYSPSNYLWAKTMIESKSGLIGSLISDYDKMGGQQFMTKMLLYWNPLQQTLDHYYDKTRSTSERLTQGFMDFNYAFYIQDKGELEIASTIWLAALDNIKVKVVKSRDENGKPLEYEKDEKGNTKVVNVYDAYTLDQSGQVVIKDNVEWSKEDEQALQKSVWSEVRRTQGRYAEWDKVKAESGWAGRMLFFYRKYLEPAIRNRFGREDPSFETGQVAMGFYNGFFRALRIYNTKNVIKSIFGGTPEETGVSAFYQRKSQMAVREMAFAVAMKLLGIAIASALPDDDEEEMDFASRILLLNAVAVFSKVQMESTSLVPLPWAGDMKGYLENFGSFTNAHRDAGRFIDVIEHGGALLLYQFAEKDSEWEEFLDKKAFYQKRTKLFQKDDAKLLKDLNSITGYMNIFELYNPEEKVELFKRKN
jgi:hypothetical protein